MTERDELEDRILYALAQGSEASFDSLLTWIEERYVRRPRVIETADELDKLGYRAVVLDVFGDALVCMRKNLRGTWWKYPTAEGECSPEFILDLGPVTVLSEGDPR